jgi:integrase
MDKIIKPKGRKGRYQAYDLLVDSVAGEITKRPKYLNGIGVMHGKRGFTVWLKIKLTHGGPFKGRIFASGDYVEIKLGSLASFDWEQLEAEFRALQGKADRGEPLEEQQDISFAEYVKTYLVYAKGRIPDEVNYKNLQRDIYNHLVPYFGHKGLRTISPADVNLWQAKLRENVAIATVKRNKNNLRAILNRALKDGLIERNPCDNSDNLKVPEKEPRYIRPDELRLIFSTAPVINDWLPDYLMWCLLTGMRQGEISKLKWENVHTPDIGSMYLSFQTGKTGKIRRITCSPVMTAILKKLKPQEVASDMRVFPYPRITIKRAWNKLRQVTGLSDIPLKSFRTTNATMGAANNIDLRTLGGRLGHTDLEMLQRHYAAFQNSSDAIAAIKIEDAVLTALNDKKNIG